MSAYDRTYGKTHVILFILNNGGRALVALPFVFDSIFRVNKGPTETIRFCGVLSACAGVRWNV